MARLDRSPLPVLRGRFSEAHARRLLWRAGCGPRRGEAARLARLGLDGAVASLTRPTGPATLHGPAPVQADGRPLDPVNVWGDAHCWWLDRMVRSDQPLIERMTLVWHSWFATSIDGTSAQLMLDQNALLRRHALGSFADLLTGITADPAMLLWLNGVENQRENPNENYGREMLELFTLGADQGYTQGDVHQNALALTGFTNDWDEAGNAVNFRWEADLHDDSVKTLFGQRGRWDWRDSCRLTVNHPRHPAFLVRKLWGYFIAGPPSAADAAALERLYVTSDFAVRPLVEAILRHPRLYTGERLVTPPAVYVAGLLRARGQGLGTDDWAWILEQAGQQLFLPPNVAGWNYDEWLDTARWAARLTAVNYVVAKRQLDASKDRHYPAHETPAQALAAAEAFWDHPPLSTVTRRNLIAYGREVERQADQPWKQVPYRVLRQNALRVLIATSPDLQTA